MSAREKLEALVESSTTGEAILAAYDAGILAEHVRTCGARRYETKSGRARVGARCGQNKYFCDQAPTEGR